MGLSVIFKALLLKNWQLANWICFYGVWKQMRTSAFSSNIHATVQAVFGAGLSWRKFRVGTQGLK
jgi:hypothetical protein